MIERLPNRLLADSKKVILQYFNISEERARLLVNKLLKISEEDCRRFIEINMKQFGFRHPEYRDRLIMHFQNVENQLNEEYDVSNDRKLLIGSYFSKEYSIEAAALFNPSIVIHPDQSDLGVGELRFILSLRATGEGHISSIEFREGVITNDCRISFENESQYSVLPSYSRTAEYESQIYTCKFHDDSILSERVLFPFSQTESMGMEDIRLVKFLDNDKYYGTYTAYNGTSVTTQLLETTDFKSFSINKLKGNAVKDKGMALFPRKINGKYYMISRQDGVNIHLMSSDSPNIWENSEIIKTPSKPWQLMQLGNCGSPLETEKGWLVITHAVGSLRRYVISAILLDSNNPSRVIGELDEPLIEPNDNEREGYVPNVVYSCGSIFHNDNLIIPYAMSDSATGFAKVSIDTILKKILN